MRILVAYATTEGQTRKVARFVADRLADAGHAVELLNVADAEGLDPGRFGAAVLAGSIHGGRYQQALEAFAQAGAQALGARPTLFLSVSLSAAGDDADDWAGIRDIAARFAEQTGWRPGRVEHVAGAFRFGEYDYFKGWMMRRIAREKGETVDPEGDTEYTDWDGLGRIVDDWAADLA
jgi:menaquinone-dependent protoporphyrinogen oxidase